MVGNNYTDSEKLQLLQEHFDEISNKGDFHGAALVAKDGVTIFEQAFGESHEGVTNTVTSKFDSASIGKSFTAVAIFQLIEAGKIALDDSIYDHIPQFGNKEAARNISIAHLLSHQSGIVDIFSYELFDKIDHEAITEFRDYFEYFQFEEPEFRAGTEFSYSNSGYLVLSAIIEAVTGKAYCDYLQQNIFDVSGMSETSCGDPAGGAETSLRDLLSFTSTVFRNNLITAEHTQLITTGLGRIEQKDKLYAFGFQVEQNEHGMKIFHNGGTREINAVMAFFPESGYTTVHYHNNSKVGFEGFSKSIEYLRALYWSS